MPDPVVTNFVDAAITQLRRHNLMRSPGKIPDSMRDTSIPLSNGWIGWRPIPSIVTNADLDALEDETSLAFPPLYRDFLHYLHFIELTETGIRFERHLPDTWRDSLRKAYFRSWPRKHTLDAGLLPFGDESFMDAGPVCFDTRHRLSDGDCPIVFWDHESEGTDEAVRKMFSSSRRMFECLSLVATSDLNFIRHDEDDDAALLPRKRELMNQFLSLDPEGAGGPAKDYWTCWGVAPG